MRDIREFASSKSPLRASRIGKLLTCPLQVVMSYLLDEWGESGSAADTGSAVHAAAAEWHGNGHDVAKAVEEMMRRTEEYPLADLSEASSLFLLYARDPRNVEAVGPDGGAVLCERKIEFEIDPAPSDPTGEKIAFWGTLDQVRRVDGVLRIYDIKTSKKPGKELLGQHAYQVATYSIGATKLFGEPVHPGSLVMPRHYPDGAFHDYPYTLVDCMAMLSALPYLIAAIRSGAVWHRANEGCYWCPQRSPNVCVPRLRTLLDPETKRIALPQAMVAAAQPQIAFDDDVFDWR